MVFVPPKIQIKNDNQFRFFRKYKLMIYQSGINSDVQCSYCHLRNMKVKLSLNLEAYYFNKNFKSLYLFGKLNNNIIFNNEIVEEKLAKVKVIIKSDNPSEFFEKIHKTPNKPNWIIDFSVDPTCVTKPLNKDGHRISTFVSEEILS